MMFQFFCLLLHTTFWSQGGAVAVELKLRVSMLDISTIACVPFLFVKDSMLVTSEVKYFGYEQYYFHTKS